MVSGVPGLRFVEERWQDGIQTLQARVFDQVLILLLSGHSTWNECREMSTSG